jgi:predicted dehydrogenase
MVRFGLAGAADIAVRRTLPALRTLAGVASLTAVASRDPARAAGLAARFGGRAHGSYDDLLADPEVDAVYLPLPAGLHAEWISRALAAGKHVLVEKPLTTGLATTAHLLRRAARAGLVLAENMTFVHHGQHALVRRLVAAGAIGEPRTVTASFTVPPRPPSDIRYQPALGGGSLLDQGVYPIRAALLHLGTGLRVREAHLRHDPDHGVDAGGSALLTGAGGTSARLTFGMDGGYTCFYELTGTDGAIRVERAFTPPPDHQPRVWLNGRPLDPGPDDQFALCLRAFAARVRAGAGPDPADGLSLAQAAIADEIRLHLKEEPGGTQPSR